MNDVPRRKIPADGPATSPGSPSPGTGEGAQTALEALKHKRQLRAEDDRAADSEPADSGLPDGK